MDGDDRDVGTSLDELDEDAKGVAASLEVDGNLVAVLEGAGSARHGIRDARDRLDVGERALGHRQLDIGAPAARLFPEPHAGEVPVEIQERVVGPVDAPRPRGARQVRTRGRDPLRPRGEVVDQRTRGRQPGVALVQKFRKKLSKGQEVLGDAGSFLFQTAMNARALRMKKPAAVYVMMGRF